MYKKIVYLTLILILAGSVQAGLVNHWKFDEPSGTTAADSGTGNDPATLYNGASFVSGASGNAVNLDGSNDYVRASSASIPSIYPAQPSRVSPCSATWARERRTSER